MYNLSVVVVEAELAIREDFTESTLTLYTTFEFGGTDGG